MDTSRDDFYQLAEDLWPAFRALADRQPGIADLTTRLHEEARINDLLAAYAYAHDSKDLDWMESLFTEDSASSLSGMNRAVEGRAAVLDLFRGWNAFHKSSHHHISNVLVRFIGPDEAWVPAYVHAFRTGHPGERESQFGRYLWRLVKQDGHWLIADRVASIDFICRYGDEARMPPGDSSPPKALRAGPGLGAGRTGFLEASKDPGAAYAWLLSHEADPAIDSEIRDLLTRYCFTHDSHDWGWFESLFTDDCVVLSGGGKIRGKVELAEAFKGWTGIGQAVQHRYSNLVSRLAPGGDQAWLAARFHMGRITANDGRAVMFGNYFGRLVRDGTEWRFTDWQVASQARLPLQASYNSARLTSGR